MNQKIPEHMYEHVHFQVEISHQVFNTQKKTNLHAEWSLLCV